MEGIQLLQDTVFQVSEADAYWRRNQFNIQDLEMCEDIPLRLLEMYNLRIRSALEVGAANGYRLQWIDYLIDLDRAVALEPSAEAIADGQRIAPQIQFVQSTAADMDLRGEQFDLVIVNYVLHWIDRTRLLQSVANIDGAVKDGGYLIIGDFAPANRMKVPYHHKPGLYTYKQDYARLFLETGLYHAVAMLSSGHGDAELQAHVPEHERYACWLLQKRLLDHYIDKGA